MPASTDSWTWKFRQRWMTDAFDAAVALRLQEWELIDAAVLAQTADWARDAQATHQEEFGFVVLDGMMRLLARTWGDPPVTPELAATVARYLSLPPDDELADAAEPLIRELVPDVAGLLESIRATLGETARGQSRRVLGAIALRLAVPRVQLLRMARRLTAVPAGPDPFGDSFQAGIDCARTDPDRSERHLREALALAPLSHTADRLLVVRTLLHRPGGGLRPQTLRTCAEQLHQLTHAGLDPVQVAMEIGRTAMQANAAQLGPELFPVLASADEKLLAGEMPADRRAVHALETAEWWLRVGRLDRCDLVLSQLRDKTGTRPDTELGCARLEAEMRRLCADTSGSGPLAAALEAAGNKPAIAADRARAIVELIFCWPVEPGPDAGRFRPCPGAIGQHDLPGWVAEAIGCISTLSAKSQNTLRVSLLAALFSVGADEQVTELSPQVSLDQFATQSADYAQWSTEFVAWAQRRLAGEPPPPGDVGKTYADLAGERRFAEAAQAAEEQAAVQERRGFRVDAYNTLLSAARLHVETGDWEAALASYDHAFALLEDDLRYVPYVELVTRRLAAWPNLYQQAAVLALRLGDPMRAVTLAETGRARATTSKLGRAGGGRPRQVSEDDWVTFTRLWRRAIAEAASNLFTAAGNDIADRHTGPARGTAEARPTDSTTELNRLRRSLLAAGVTPAELAPVAPPADVSGVPSWLATAARPTAILYPIQIRQLTDSAWDTIRFVRIGGNGITEIPLNAPDRTEIVHIIERFGADVRAARQTPAALVAGLVDTLGPRLEPVLSQAVAGVEDGRLIWVPQGPAAGLPIAALPCRDGQLIDLVSVMVAPSLLAIADAAAPDAVQPLRGVAVEGPARSDQAGTDGGASVLGNDKPVIRPASVAEVSDAVGDSTVVYLSCHGHFRWDRPLSSSLQLGADRQHVFDLPVADIFDQLQLPPGELILLGACDSGTIAQTDLNEGVGLPAAFLAAGAGAVIGASWPVPRGVAVGVCLKFWQGLGRGQASPEALRNAVRWVRDASIARLDEELVAIGHPLHSDATATPAQVELRRLRPVSSLADWASYVHWGGGINFRQG
jgi:tetratricopeptide (TPR) repeat protein